MKNASSNLSDHIFGHTMVLRLQTMSYTSLYKQLPPLITTARADDEVVLLHKEVKVSLFSPESSAPWNWVPCGQPGLLQDWFVITCCVHSQVRFLKSF